MNKKVSIADRSNVFYWQTDRAVEPEEAGAIWADRHRYFTDSEIQSRVNEELAEDKLVRIEKLDLGAQTNLGNVNSVREGQLASGTKVIIRCHPKGIENGYFYAESAAANAARNHGLPTYETLAVHEFQGGDDFAFQVITKMPGTAIQRWLESHPHDEPQLLRKMGVMMARLHQVQVDGFGPFDNNKAKAGQLVGIHQSLGDSVRAGLDFNLNELTKAGVVAEEKREAIGALFDSDQKLLQASQAVLVHNDFADWNLLTDGQDVTGILDWDETVASDPVADIACWSTFFDPARIDGFLDGYWQNTEKPLDFQEKFELLRLRYVLSKMTLRIRRYTWSPTEEVKQKIEFGKKHLAESMEYFGI